MLRFFKATPIKSDGGTAVFYDLLTHDNLYYLPLI